MKTTQAIIEKGKALLNTATKNAAHAVNDYITVPGFKDYEINSKNVLRSKKTGNIQQIPAGKKKYLIFASNGTRKSIGTEEINALIGTRIIATAKTLLTKTSCEIEEMSYFISYTPFRKRIIPDPWFLFSGKFINYLLMLIIPSFRDTLFILGKK